MRLNAVLYKQYNYSLANQYWLKVISQKRYKVTQKENKRLTTNDDNDQEEKMLLAKI